MSRRKASEGVPAAAPPVEWLLVYQPAGGTLRLPWLVVEGVPAEAPRSAVLEALQLWPLWGRYAPAPGGTTTLLQAGKWGALDVDGVERKSWEELAPKVRRLTVGLDGPDHALITMAARRRGLTLTEWAGRTLAAAAAQQLGAVPTHEAAAVTP